MKIILTFLALLASITAVSASVTLNIRTQLANSAGVATNDMYWGVLIDTAGDGFAVTSSGTIDSFDFTSNGTIDGDNYFVGTSQTRAAGSFGSAGVALSTPAIDLTGGIAASDSFGIFWGVNSTTYGFVTTSGAVLPSDGATVAFNTVFTSDPYTAQGTIGVVPEPSTYAMFAGALALGYVMIRRRK